MVGREYAARYLSAEDRRQAAWIVDKVREVQIEAVKNSSWMSAEAKTEAQAKLAALKIEIGTRCATSTTACSRWAAARSAATC
jgi:putative endopeptidase